MTQIPTTAAPATSNNVKIEDAGPARKRLTVTVPAEAVDNKLREPMGALSTGTIIERI